ncbi:hypothetical protein SPRG_20011 [Saprolegnia parasitica CBS 223.65]|uniref:Fanconi-associated nuclease n=1 Tax=Saprolegnia parasitica (strain CBS 223.65) TaxID=695850 RepID=A0A067CDH4_SAPPC|nr:hypothetical protein SPRG_20011 [Saprolegnia parasitica CBS 223.65]KDO28804.1 hypothetical protein SPRG_20011 [Saprolegnia parasitica CBS 223.65]|eukprot:XP_012200539.1 hypothetical protein SPRG_20011 [Saprolegnia parasitica CBS 223.65]
MADDDALEHAEDVELATADSDAYMQHFCSVLTKMKAIFWALLAPAEQAMVDDFLALAEPAQALYARLFQRKGPWFRSTSLEQYLTSKRINWSAVDDDDGTPPLQRALSALHAAGFVAGLNHDTKEFSSVLHAIARACPLPEVALILQAVGASTKGKTKGDMLERLRTHVSTQRRLDGSFLPLAATVQRVLYDTATCAKKTKNDLFLVQIAPESRSAFRRMHHLAYLTASFTMPTRAPPKTPSWDEWRQVFFANEPVVWPGLLQTFNRFMAPTYICTPSAGMFPSLHALVLYECSRRLRQAMYSIGECIPVQSKVLTREPSLSIEWLDHSPPSLLVFQSPAPLDDAPWKMACHRSVDTFLRTFADLDALVLEVRHALRAYPAQESDVARPPFFAHFDGGYQLVKALDSAITIYEKLGQHDKAVVLLQEALAARRIGYKRGSWYVRLAVNLHMHLKQPNEAITICDQGLADAAVRDCDRLVLRRKLVRLRKPSPNNDNDDDNDDESKPNELGCYLSEAIEGRPLNRATGEKSRFIGYDDAGVSVEELVLQHYNRDGWYGSHREGAEMRMLFGLLLWDVIFMPQPHVFQTLYQDRPLDLDIRYAAHFYAARADAIDATLSALAAMSTSDLTTHIGQRYDGCEGQNGYGMSWSTSRGYLQLLAAGLGGSSLSRLLRLWVTECDSSGMPDLILVRVPTEDGYANLQRYIDRTETSADADEVPLLLLEASQVQLVEVKGPRDALSDTQLVWLNRFRQAEMCAKVCFVHEPDEKSKAQAKKAATRTPATKRPRKPSRTTAKKRQPGASILGVAAKRIPEVIEISDDDDE